MRRAASAVRQKALKATVAIFRRAMANPVNQTKKAFRKRRLKEATVFSAKSRTVIELATMRCV